MALQEMGGERRGEPFAIKPARRTTLAQFGPHRQHYLANLLILDTL